MQTSPACADLDVLCETEVCAAQWVQPEIEEVARQICTHQHMDLVSGRMYSMSSQPDRCSPSQAKESGPASALVGSSCVSHTASISHDPHVNQRLRAGWQPAPSMSFSNMEESRRRMRAVRILFFSSARCPDVTVVAAGMMVLRTSCNAHAMFPAGQMPPQAPF